jgi:hypothetical protein
MPVRNRQPCASNPFIYVNYPLWRLRRQRTYPHRNPDRNRRPDFSDRSARAATQCRAAPDRIRPCRLGRTDHHHPGAGAERGVGDAWPRGGVGPLVHDPPDQGSRAGVAVAPARRHAGDRLRWRIFKALISSLSIIHYGIVSCEIGFFSRVHRLV